MIKQDKKLKAQLFKTKKTLQRQKELMTQSSLIKPTAEVVQETSDSRTLLQIKQQELKTLAPIANAQNIFNLSLPKGPYSLSANPQFIYFAGRHGHIGMFNWRTSSLECEIDVKSKVYDIHWVAQGNFAVAQENAVYMYDKRGTEIHKIRDHKNPLLLEYLPYHYLLTSVNKFGRLVYQDITHGQVVISYQTTSTPLCLQQNPSTSVLAIGDTHGVARFYTPNSGSPAMSILCSKSSLNAISFTRDGNYMVTGGGDGIVKAWDLRTCKQLPHEILMPQQVGKLSISQKGVIAASSGNHINIVKDFIYGSSYRPYMKHQCDTTVQGLEFIDHEDYLAATTNDQYLSLLIPESGEPNFDTFEANQFQTKKQRSESHVRSLLEKLQPSSIHINPHLIGTIDRASKDVIEKEKRLEQEVRNEKQTKKQKKKMRGRNSVKKRFLLKENVRTEEQVKKWQTTLSDSIRIRKAEKLKRKHEQNMLNQLEDMSAKQFIKAITNKKTQPIIEQLTEAVH